MGVEDISLRHILRWILNRTTRLLSLHRLFDKGGDAPIATTIEGCNYRKKTCEKLPVSDLFSAHSKRMTPYTISHGNREARDWSDNMAAQERQVESEAAVRSGSKLNYSNQLTIISTKILLRLTRLSIAISCLNIYCRTAWGRKNEYPPFYGFQFVHKSNRKLHSLSNHMNIF